MSDIFDELLETNLDDIADLPEYADYIPTGTYHLRIVESEKKFVEVQNKETKAKEKAPVIQFTYEIVEPKELKDPQEENLLKPGMRFNESFWLNGDAEAKKKTLEIIKVKFKELSAKFGWSSLGDVIAGAKGVEVFAIVKSKASDKDADKFFIGTKNMQPL